MRFSLFVLFFSGIVLFWFFGVSTPLGGRFFGYVRYGLGYTGSIGRHASLAFLDDRTDERVDQKVLESQIGVLREENDSLRELLKFTERFSINGVGARVLSRTSDLIAEELIVDRGLNDGVVKGAPVIASDGVLVGIVSQVEEHISVVRLLIDPVSRVSGRLLNVDQSEGVVSGGHGIVVRMELIPRDEHVAQGMFLVTSGLDDAVPRGLLVGEVVAVEPDPNTLFVRAIIAPPVDYDRLQFVLIGSSL